MKHDVKTKKSTACKEKPDVTSNKDQHDTKPMKHDVKPSESPACKEKHDVEGMQGQWVTLFKWVTQHLCDL